MNSQMITAKFGKTVIFNEDLNKHFTHINIREIQWTENLIYRNSSLSDVKTTFNSHNNFPSKIQNSIDNRDNIIANSTIESNISADYFDKKSAFEGILMKKKDIIESKKCEFISKTLNIETNSDKGTILKSIKEKFFELVKNDESLRLKLRYVNNSINMDNINNTNNMTNLYCPPNLNSNSNINNNNYQNNSSFNNQSAQINDNQNNYKSNNNNSNNYFNFNYQ